MDYFYLLMPIVFLVVTYNSPTLNGFVAGMYFSSGMTMAHQDWHGLAEYKEYLDEKWVDLHWGVGATIAIIAFMFFVLQTARFARYNRKLKSR